MQIMIYRFWLNPAAPNSTGYSENVDDVNYKALSEF